VDIQALESQIAELKAEVEALKKRIAADKLTIAVFSGELDKVYTAFVIAAGAAAMGMEVVMYFTLWAIPALRDENKTAADQEGAGKILGADLPRGAGELKLSENSPGGIDTAAFKAMMEKNNVPSLEQMISMAAELGIRIYLSDKSTQWLGFRRDEFIDYPGLDFAGVATFLHEAGNSKVQLVI